MSIAHADLIWEGLPAESRLLDEVTVRLIQSEEDRCRHDDLLNQEHYLRNANAIGRVLRYVAEYRGEWVSVLTFCSASLHLKPRDRYLNWSAREVSQRRHLVAQNSRFLILPSTGRWPNLASRVLKVVCDRLSEDWQIHFGHPVLLAETFVDPQRFRGTCYKAAGWQALGKTRGFERCGQDFYADTQHPKELWVLPLGPRALEGLRAEQLPSELIDPSRPAPPLPPVKTALMDSLWQHVHKKLRELDPRPVQVLHLDGKVLKNADPAPARLSEDPALAQAAATIDTPVELQKPKAEKALTLVNFQTPEQRLIDQIAVPQDTNEEAAVAAHLPKMDLAGVIVIGDAAHTTKANCRLLTQDKGADYLFFLKGNQPNAHAKAKQLLHGDAPPSGSVDR